MTEEELWACYIRYAEAQGCTFDYDEWRMYPPTVEEDTQR